MNFNALGGLMGQANWCLRGRGGPPRGQRIGGNLNPEMAIFECSPASQLQTVASRFGVGFVATTGTASCCAGYGCTHLRKPESQSGVCTMADELCLVARLIATMFGWRNLTHVGELVLGFA